MNKIYFSFTQNVSNYSKQIYPSVETAFKAFLSSRFCAAMWSHISDCDETYNYWEPVIIFQISCQT